MRLIDADELLYCIEMAKEHFLNEGKHYEVHMAKFMLNVLKTEGAMPTIEAEPVRHAQWESYPGRAYRRCSLCKKEFEKTKFGVRANYCPNCGAKMDKETIIKVTKPDCEECEHFKWHDPECGSCNEESGYRYFKHA